MSNKNNFKPRLGRGLESLLSNTSTLEKKEGSFLSSGKTIVSLPLDHIEFNEYQPRLHFDKSSIQQLSDSIKKHGLAQPIIVRRKEEKYELIAGERRYRATKQAGLKKIQVIIRDINDPMNLKFNKISGGINIIDLANLYSCSFIATDDLGKTNGKNEFKINGRIDNSDLRGCNLLLD